MCGCCCYPKVSATIPLQKGVIMKFYQDNKSKKFTRYDGESGAIELVTSEGLVIARGDTAIVKTGLRVRIDGHTVVPISVVPPLAIVRIFVEDNGELCLIVYNHSNGGNIILEGGDFVAAVTFVKSVTLTRVNTVKDLME